MLELSIRPCLVKFCLNKRRDKLFISPSKLFQIEPQAIAIISSNLINIIC